MDSYSGNGGRGGGHPQFSDLSNPQIIETLQKNNLVGGQEEIPQEGSQDQSAESKYLPVYCLSITKDLNLSLTFQIIIL